MLCIIFWVTLYFLLKAKDYLLPVQVLYHYHSRPIVPYHLACQVSSQRKLISILMNKLLIRIQRSFGGRILLKSDIRYKYKTNL